MNKALVIVESPTKAKTISKYLGDKYLVRYSLGHIRDLPSGSKGKRKKRKSQTVLDKMGVDPFNGWVAKYEILPDKKSIVEELKQAAKESDEIYLATDLDREGEAIAWHLSQVLYQNEDKFKRVVFNEITKDAIRKAFGNPQKINMERVYAQQARRFLDRVVGFMLSPLLWVKIARGLSAGRVQSVAVRLVVERERKIRQFVPKPYWTLNAILKNDSGESIDMEVSKWKGKAITDLSLEEINEAKAILKTSEFSVTNVSRKERKVKAYPPYTTSSLQQAASSKLGFSVSRTMHLAQKLYELGYITYMRTDSTNISEEAMAMVISYIDQNMDVQYLPKTPNQYQNKQGSQEAHEAIRPSDVNISSKELKGVEDSARKLYELIWCQFVASQCSEAIYQIHTITSQTEDALLQAKFKEKIFDGWTCVFPNYDHDTCKVIPSIKVGERLSLQEILDKEHLSRPPNRYTEASLVKQLEDKGIGRPSTYASIISTIQERGYVRLEKKNFYAQKMGELVTDRLIDNFSDLMSYDFTASMESYLDMIANCQTGWKEVLDNFFEGFHEKLLKAEKPANEGGLKPNEPVKTDIKCPKCGLNMDIRVATTGIFIACSGYLDKENPCKNTIDLVLTNDINDSKDTNNEQKRLLNSSRCSKCNFVMEEYYIDDNTQILICSNMPSCEEYKILHGNFSLGPKILCDCCNSTMVRKKGRFGSYIKCTNESCNNTRKILKNGEVGPPRSQPIDLPLPCEKSDAHFVLRKGASGLFLAAHNFPKSRETRSPLVEELVRFKDLLPQEFFYLTKAPTKDPDGNKTVLRYDSKKKSQYIGSKNGDKYTKWKWFYENEEWKLAN